MFRSQLRITPSNSVLLSSSWRHYSRFSVCQPWLWPCCRFSPSSNIVEASTSNLQNFLNEHVTAATCKNLIPGSVQRHTKVLPYGMVGREKAVIAVKELFTTLAEGEVRADFPLFLVISTPRQGKTLFLDTVANDPDIIARWKNPSAKHQLRRDHCLVFNLTFNSEWNIDRMTRPKEEIPVGNAVYHITLRVLAAAANISKPKGSAFAELRHMLDQVIKTTEYSLGDIIDILQLHVTRKLDMNLDQVRWIFLYDEFTKLSDRVSIQIPAGEQTSPREDLYSQVTSALDDNNCVIISGFNRRQAGVSASGRKIRDCELPPLDTAATRKNSLVLSTIYFQLVSTMKTVQAVYHYELLKSSPGVLGAVIEGILTGARSNEHSIKNIVEELPIIGLLASSGTEEVNIESILQWKSVQFTYLPDSCENDDSTLMTVVPSKSGQNWLKSDSALDPLSKWVHMPAGFPTLNGPDAARSSLYNVHVEPLFLAAAAHGHFYEEFLRLLENYDRALANLSSNHHEIARALVRSHFRSAEKLPIDDSNDSRIELFDNELQNRFQQQQQQQRRVQQQHKGRHKLAAYFFEDAVAVGICYQKSLRRDLSCRFPLTMASSILRLFDNGLDVGDETKFRQVFTNCSALPWVKWVGPSLRSRPEATLWRFVGEFPCTPDRHQIQVNKVVEEGSTTEFCAQQGEGIDEPRIHQCFTAHHVLQPARPESNALADVIFHEEFTNEAKQSRLVQFWIDTKHSHERHGKIINDAANPKKFVSNVIAALNNPLLRSEHCRVDHIVHVIISTVPKWDVEKKLSKLFSEKNLFCPKTQKNNYRATLPTYTLLVVHPESYAFQNLVSQPIANSIPLLDQQLNNSWCQKLGTPFDFARYRATTKYGLDTFIAHEQDFSAWRKNRMNDELISSIASCASDGEELKNDVLRAACSSKRPSGIDVESLNKIAQLPVGLILEKLHVVAAPDPQLAYSKLIPKFKFDVSPPEAEAFNPVLSMVSLPNSGSDAVEIDFNMLHPHFCDFLVRRCVLIGELVDGNNHEHNPLQEVQNAWSVFFENCFLDCWRVSLKETHDRQLWACSGDTHATRAQQKIFSTVSAFGASMIAGTLWNAFVEHWQLATPSETSITFGHNRHRHHHESVLCCSTVRHMSKNYDSTRSAVNVNPFVSRVDALIETKMAKFFRNFGSI